MIVVLITRPRAPDTRDTQKIHSHRTAHTHTHNNSHKQTHAHTQTWTTHAVNQNTHARHARSQHARVFDSAAPTTTTTTREPLSPSLSSMSLLALTNVTYSRTRARRLRVRSFVLSFAPGSLTLWCVVRRVCKRTRCFSLSTRASSSQRTFWCRSRQVTKMIYTDTRGGSGTVHNRAAAAAAAAASVVRERTRAISSSSSASASSFGLASVGRSHRTSHEDEVCARAQVALCKCVRGVCALRGARVCYMVDITRLYGTQSVSVFACAVGRALKESENLSISIRERGKKSRPCVFI